MRVSAKFSIMATVRVFIVNIANRLLLRLGITIAYLVYMGREGQTAKAAVMLQSKSHFVDGHVQPIT